MSSLADDLTNTRVSLTLLNSDPGRPGELELPNEPITGTIIGEHIGPHGRLHYYVLLDRPLKLDTAQRQVTSVYDGGDARDTKGRATRIISIYASKDRPSPPQDTLGPSLRASGRGTAEGVILVFRADLPQEIGLYQWQDDGRKPVNDRDYDAVGYAEVILV